MHLQTMSICTLRARGIQIQIQKKKNLITISLSLMGRFRLRQNRRCRRLCLRSWRPDRSRCRTPWGLAAEGVPRSLIGQWARNYGNGTVVDAYQEYRAACMRGEKAEPKTYIIAVLNRMVGKRGDDRSIMGSSKRVMEMFNQEQERRRQVALEYLQVEGHS
jgi:hypothetical protein